MHQRSNALSSLVVFLSVVSFVALAHGGTVVFLEADAIGGIKKTAGKQVCTINVQDV